MNEKLQIHDSFWLLLAVILLIDTDMVFPAFLFCAAVHELGHFVMIRLFHGSVNRFHLSAAGGMMQYQLPRLSRHADLCIALGGPVFGLLLAYGASIAHAPLIAGASLLLSVFNLLPIPPLDGGRALESLFFPGHAFPKAIAYFFAVLVLFGGISLGIAHNGWGLAVMGLLLVFEQQIGLQSVHIQGKI